MRPEQRRTLVAKNAGWRRLAAFEAEAELRRDGDRRHELRRQLAPGSVKRRRSDARHRELSVVDLDGPADDQRIRTEVPTPETVAEDDDGRGAGFIGGHERPPQRRVDAEHIEIARGDELGERRMGISSSSERYRRDGGSEQAGERGVVVADVLVIGIRERDRAAGARLREDDRHPRRAADACERVEGQALQHREHGRVQANPEREHGDDRAREYWFLGQIADCVADVAHQIRDRVHPPRRPYPPRRLGRQGDVAKILQRREAGFAGVGAVGNALFGRHREVDADFLAQVVLIETVSFQPRPQTHGATPRPPAQPATSRG